MSTPLSIPEVLTVREACERLKISRSTLYTRRYRYTVEGGPTPVFASDIALALTLTTVNPE